MKIENKPDGLFSINSFVPERHKTVRIAGGKTMRAFSPRSKPKRSGMEVNMEKTSAAIRGEELENLRRRAVSRHKALFRIPILVFVLLLLLELIFNRHGLLGLLTGALSGPSAAGALLHLAGGVMLALTVAAASFCLFYLFGWRKCYDRFNICFKSRYVLQTLKEVPEFSDLSYESAQGQFSFQELSEIGVVPMGEQSLFRTTDRLEGKLGKVAFRSGNITTAEPSASRRQTTPTELFNGQILAFSLFDDRKISEGRLQVLPEKASKQMRREAHRVETENMAFNARFSVYTQDEHNAFYILTPQVIERIMEFAEAAGENVFLVFEGPCLYVGVQQFRQPFDAFLDIPLEEQRKNILEDSRMMLCAGEILIQAGKNERQKKGNSSAISV